jgi:hypothetical protein
MAVAVSELLDGDRVAAASSIFGRASADGVLALADAMEAPVSNMGSYLASCVPDSPACFRAAERAAVAVDTAIASASSGLEAVAASTIGLTMCATTVVAVTACDVAEVTAEVVAPLAVGAALTGGYFLTRTCEVGFAFATAAASALYDKWPILDRQVSYPVGERPHLGSGHLLDDEHYVQPFCLKCSGVLIEALCSFEEGVAQHTCVCWIPTRCQACDENFFPRGLQERDLVERRVYCPSEMCVTFKAMGHTKQAHQKKNWHLAWTAFCEGKNVDVRREALMDFMVRITQLHSHPARVFPRWAALPVLRCIDWSYPLRLGSRFATSWEPMSKHGEAVEVEVASHPLVALDAATTANGGFVPTVERVQTPEVLGDLGMEPGPRLSDPTASGSGPGGQNYVTPSQIAPRIGPLLGPDVTVYDPNSHGNAQSVVAERVGDSHAGKCRFSWRPTPEMQAEAEKILAMLKKEVFTKERVVDACRNIGSMEDAFSGKLSEDATRTLVNELLSGYKLDDKVPLMVKKEVMQDSSKPPRGVMNMGLHSFISGAYVHKVLEYILSNFDDPVNIKHRPKSEVMDELTRKGSFEGIYEGEGSLDTAMFNPASARFVESDYGKFEFSQRWEFKCHADGLEAGWRIEGMDQQFLQGMLGWEMSLINHVERLIPHAYNELWQRRQKPKKATTVFVPCVKDENFKRFNWRFTLFLLCRRSGDAQTSYGNRLHNLMAMAISNLKQGRDLFWRLLDIMTGRKKDTPNTWVFKFPDGSMQYWRPCAEGDDYAAHTIGNKQLCENKGCIDLEVITTHKDVLERLNLFGLESKYFLRLHGRLEFVGVHCLIESGFTIPGAWAPDVKRGLVKASVGTTKTFEGKTRADRMQIALSYASRAAMFAGRIDPMALFYGQLAESWATHDELEAATDVRVKLNWDDASLLGLAYGESADLATLDRLYCKLGSDKPLEPRIQRRLCELSVGGAISDVEWAKWSGGGYTAFDDPVDVLSNFPLAVRPTRKSAA